MKCILKIYDEVNVKFIGLDVPTRRKLVNKLKFFMPQAYHMPSYKLGRWDGTISFCTLGGASYFNLLDELLPIVIEDGYEVEIEDNRPQYEFNFSKIDENYLEQLGKVWPEGHMEAGNPIKLRDYQVDIINNFFENLQSIQEAATGSGKCQPYHAKVLTNVGWKLMGELSIGDRVITPEGKESSIINIFEPGNKRIYKIKFIDGREVECCKDHLWKIYNIDWRSASKNGGPWRVVTTEELIHYYINKRNNRGISVQLVEPIKYPKKEFPLDPWFLGLMLGDGSFANNKFSFTSADVEIVNGVQNLLLSDYKLVTNNNLDYSITLCSKELKNKYHSEHISKINRDMNGRILNSNLDSYHYYYNTAKILKLNGLKSHEKFIPEIYKFGSVEQRLNLIQGLMDSDGYVGKNGELSYATVSEKLAKDIQEIIWGLGGICTIKTGYKYYTCKGERKKGRLTYFLGIRYRNPKDLVRLSRKRNRISDNYQYKDSLRLKVLDYEITDVTEPVRCIMIDDPNHLYITDNYVVTHNTLITATVSQIIEKYGKTIVIVPNKSLVTQTETDYKLLGLDVGVYYGDRKELDKTHTICTWQSLEALERICKKKELDENLLYTFAEDKLAVIVDECFSGDTLIYTPNGWSRIDNLQKGDIIINYSENDKTFKDDIVEKVLINLPKSFGEDLYELEFDNGIKIKVTGNHKVLTSKGWKLVNSLTLDDDIINIYDNM